METDDLYAQPLSSIVDFRFDESVARVFPDMLRRSVPGYGTLIALTGILAAEYARPGSVIYDLGASLGASTLAMRHHLSGSGCHIIAVDNSAAMAKRCRELAARETSDVPVTVLETDIGALSLQPCSFVVLNLTLQFLPPERRAALVEAIHAALVPGGALLLTEKVQCEDAPFDALHAAFKRRNGYSELEISQKRTALEQVLRPETEQAHIDRLRAAGFSAVHGWFRCLQFVSLLAIR